jgi:chitin synthase
MGKSKKPIINDLCSLSNISLDTLVQQLKTRYESNLIYTCISDGALVCLNPGSSNQTSQNSTDYVAEYKDTSLSTPLSPHIFQMVNQTYLHMRRTGIDQSIVLR